LYHQISPCLYLTSCFSLPIFNVLFLLAYIKRPVSPCLY
jgi:hypothetical protein